MQRNMLYVHEKKKQALYAMIQELTVTYNVSRSKNRPGEHYRVRWCRKQRSVSSGGSRSPAFSSAGGIYIFTKAAF